MKRTSSAYRLQLIKDIVVKQDHEACKDPMAKFIYQLMSDKADYMEEAEKLHRFSGKHFDSHAGGWVSDKWAVK